MVCCIILIRPTNDHREGNDFVISLIKPWALASTSSNSFAYSTPTVLTVPIRVEAWRWAALLIRETTHRMRGLLLEEVMIHSASLHHHFSFSLTKHVSRMCAVSIYYLNTTVAHLVLVVSRSHFLSSFISLNNDPILYIPVPGYMGICKEHKSYHDGSSSDDPSCFLR